MSHSSLQSARDRAAKRQAGLCHYCELPMLLPASPASRKLPSFVVSAEHLVARCAGGSDTAPNIVAAHVVCNQRRHKRPAPLPPEDYKGLVKRRMARGRWHPDSVVKRLRKL